jgi:hypothetical protein
MRLRLLFHWALLLAGVVMASMSVYAYTMLHVGAQGLAKGVPDFCEEMGSVVVANGVTTTWGPGTLTAPCYGAHGNVTIADGTIFETKHIISYSDGSITWGTSGDPGAGRVEFQDVALDTDQGDDPEQFGNSLMCFGTCLFHGEPKTSFIRLAAEVADGATTLTCGGANDPADPAPSAENCPADWEAGDLLFLPDTRQLPEGSLPVFPNNAHRPDSEYVVIDSIAGSTITLDAPTQHAHLGAHEPTTDTLRMLPHVGNMTRSIVFTSENTATTLRRGMTLASQRAVIDWRYVEFESLGRTTAQFLDSTTFSGSTVTHVGTNQIGKYPVHMHHLYGPVTPQSNGYQFTLKGLSIRDFKKWGMAIHNSHHGLIEDNIIVDGEGSSFVTEDGAETGNVFQRNFAAKIGILLTDLDNIVVDEADFNPHGRKGSCYWFRSPTQVLIDNVCADTREGYDWETSSQENGPFWGGNPVEIPDFQGADTSTTANTSTTIFIDRPNMETRGNEAYSTSEFGYGFWSASWSQLMSDIHNTADENAGRLGQPVEDLLLWHNTKAAIRFQYGDIIFNGGLAINNDGQGEFMHLFNDAAPLGNGNAATEYNDLEVRGYSRAYRMGGQLGQQPFFNATGGTYQTLNSAFYFSSAGQMTFADYALIGSNYVQTSYVTLDGVQFEAMPGEPLLTIELDYDDGYAVGGYSNSWEPHRRHNIQVTNYQGDADRDFRLWYDRQAPGAAAPNEGPAYGLNGDTYSGCPTTVPHINSATWAAHTCATMMEVAPAGTTTLAEMPGALIDGDGGPTLGSRGPGKRLRIRVR